MEFPHFDYVLGPAPRVVTSKTIEDRLQSWLVIINYHCNIVDKPLNKIAVVLASCVSECQMELLGQLLRNVRLDVRDDGLIVASCG